MATVQSLGRAGFALAALIMVLAAGCGGNDEPSSSGDMTFAPMRSLSDPAGKGGFRFGAASAATQIEDGNTTTDWYLWTQPKPDGLGNGTFVGDAAKGYTLALADIELLEEPARRFVPLQHRVGADRAQAKPNRRSRHQALLRLHRRAARCEHSSHRDDSPLLESGVDRRPARSDLREGSDGRKPLRLWSSAGWPTSGRRARRARQALGRALRRSRGRVGHHQRAHQLSARRLRRRCVPARQERISSPCSTSSCRWCATT